MNCSYTIDIFDDEVVFTCIPNDEYISKVVYKHPKNSKKGTMIDIMKEMVIDHLRDVKKVDI